MAKEGRPLRCAIYTRKSTEEGLDKAFNSLDAQREACAAYVLSQQHEGWTLNSDTYDDGGFSGGNLERPGLKQLLADVRAGQVDIVVVYKIDRLTRSLSDFAKIVDVLDAADASFVSVTQAFSTTTSMGRLTLNVLLSFAQFEREVIAERIRDKVAASKARGMWMGGPVPLGYQAKDRKLIVVPSEAATVNDIMQRYLASPSVRDLVEELRHAGVVSKRRKMRDGSHQGGGPFARGAICWLLSNRVYVGETVHKGTAYPGQHDAIVDRDLFDAVQAKLADKAAAPKGQPVRRSVSLLAGMIHDERGRPMSPCHTSNHGRRYSYYASSMNDDAGSPAQRLPAGELEAGVRSALAQWIGKGENVRQLRERLDAESLARLFKVAAVTGATLESGSIAEARGLLTKINLSVRVSAAALDATISSKALLALAGIPAHDDRLVSLVISTSQASYGHEPRLRLEPNGTQQPRQDDRLVELIARAFAARDELLTLDAPVTKDVPVTRLRHLQRLARLSYLEPSILRAVLSGEQPRHLSARTLWRMGELSLDWSEQRAALHLPPA